MGPAWPGRGRAGAVLRPKIELREVDCKGLTASSADPVNGSAWAQDAGKEGEKVEACMEGERDVEEMTQLEKEEEEEDDQEIKQLFNGRA